MRQGFVTLNFARCSMVDRHRHRGRGRFLHTPKRCRMGIYDTYVHSYLIWNWVITSPITIMGERSFQWIQKRARWSALIFLFFLSTHAYIFIIYYYMFTHTHTLTWKDNKRFVFTSNINENSSSSSASASSNQLGDVLGHTCVEDDHERWYWCCLRCWRQQQQRRWRPGGPVVLPRALNFMISDGRWGCRICMQVGQHIHTCMSVCVCVMNVIAQIADA